MPFEHEPVPAVHVFVPVSVTPAASTVDAASWVASFPESAPLLDEDDDVLPDDDVLLLELDDEVEATVPLDPLLPPVEPPVVELPPEPPPVDDDGEISPELDSSPPSPSRAARRSSPPLAQAPATTMG